MKKPTARVTLKDIAEATGFSINTVSRALNDKYDISDATKKIIHSKAYELGYMKNTIASSLRTGYTKTIAVIVGDIANPMFGAIAKYIEKRAGIYGYSTIIFNTDEDPKVEKASIYSALGKTVDGIIFCPSQRSTKPLQLLLDSGCPFVLLGRHFKEYATDYVISNDVKGAFLAVEHLITQYNCRKILFLNGPEYVSSAYDRLLGYRTALKEYNIPFLSELVRQCDIIKSGQVLKQIKEIEIGFDGIFAFSDLIALQVLSYWYDNEADLLDLPIIGYDNIKKDLDIPYPLSSINYSKHRMANALVDTLLKKIRDPKRAIVQNKISTELIDRS